MRFIIFRLLFVLVLISSCSGGGGGDSSSSGSDSSSSGSDTSSSGSSGSDVLGFRVLNGAIDAAPVDLVSSIDNLVQNSIFAQPQGYSQVSSGLHQVSISTSNSPSGPIFSTVLSHESELKQSIILHGDRSNFGLRFFVLTELLPEVPSGRSLVRIIHAATGANQLSLNAATVADFGRASDYMEIGPGQNVLTINRVVDSVLFDTVTLNAESGRAYSIFVAGEFGFFVTSRVLEEN